MKIKVSTRYDCRRTGVTGHYRAGSAQFTDLAGQPVVNQPTWNRSRNQQRNLETLTQLVGMRTQLMSMTDANSIAPNSVIVIFILFFDLILIFHF